MRKIVPATLLALFIMILSVVTALADEVSVFYLTDPVSEVGYTITQKDEEITVSLNSAQIGVAYVEDICGFSLCNNVLSMFSVDSLNGNLNCYFFDFYNDSIDSTTITAFAYENPLCFAVDCYKNVYFISESDVSEVNFYSNNRCEKIKLLSPVKELLTVDSGGVLAICTDKVYYIENGSFEEISGLKLSVPVSLIGNGIVRDTGGFEYNLREAETIAPTTIPTETTEPLEIPEFYFCESGTTVSKIKKAFANLEVTRITKANGTDIKNGKVGTATIVYFENGESMTIIIKGELTGEGNINSRDLKTILNHLCRKELLEGSFLIAADIDGDNEVTTKDALYIAKSIK